MAETKSSSLMATFKAIFAGIPSRSKKKFGLLMFSSFTVAIGETFAMGAIALFASAVASPETILQSPYFKTACEYVSIDPATDPGRLVAIFGLVVVLLVILKNGLRGFNQYAVNNFTGNASAFLADKMMDGFLRMPYEWLTNRNTADLRLAVSWARGPVGAFLNSFLVSASDAMIVVCMLAVLMLVNPAVVLPVLGGMGLIAWLIFTWIRRLVDRKANEVAGHMKSVNLHMSKVIDGMKDVIISGKEQAFLGDFTRDLYKIPRCQALQNVYGQLPGWVLETIGFAVLCLATFYMYYVAEESSAKVTGTIALLAVTAWRGLPAVIRILVNLTAVRTNLPLVRECLEYMEDVERDADYSELDRSSVQEPLPFERDIHFRDIGFTYLGADGPALNEVDFTLKKGLSMGLIGQSGAGKSTLTDLMIGLLKPEKGSIMVDGRPLETRDRVAWMRNIGYVPQVSYIYDGTLAENVAFGVSGADIDRARVQECCDMAAVTEFMGSLEHGLDTKIGERGARLSGGQRQRVAIARALYNRPEILVFDEATSSLDSRSEKSIQETIFSFKGQVTMVVVAHRLSTVRDCDFLVWIKDGRVEMIGPPSEVLPRYENQMENVEGAS